MHDVSPFFFFFFFLLLLFTVIIIFYYGQLGYTVYAGTYVDN